MSTESTSPPSPLSTPKQPWEPETVVDLPEKPNGWDYGYIVQNKAYGCTRQGLVEAVTNNGISITCVWTPDSTEAVQPETVEFLLPGYQKRIKNEARTSILIGLALVGFASFLAVVFGQWRLIYASFFGVFGLLAIVSGVWELYGANSSRLEDFEAERTAHRFSSWVEKKKLSGHTIALCASIIAVGAVQIVIGEKESIDAAGLVKPAVWQGQVWRLSTATLMHVNLTHIWMNMASLLFLSRMIEWKLNAAFLPIVFFASGICGSIFSLFLYPNTTSVGASGGIMGLLGFLTLAVWLRREDYPTQFLQNQIKVIAFTGLLGLIGFAFIDNAAHLGGLLCGGALGWIFLRSRNCYDGLALGILSAITLVLVILTAVFAGGKLLGIW